MWHRSCAGEPEQRGGVGRPWQVLLLPPPFVSPSLSIGSASCRNFSPSGWQPQQVPAWGGLAAMKAERREDRGLLPASLLTMHGDVDAPYTPFPELTHRCYYSGKYWTALANSKLSSLCPNYCVALVLKSPSLASEPETKRNRICLYPAQQMVVVIAKALINPSGLRRVQSRALPPALAEDLPSASFLEL